MPRMRIPDELHMLRGSFRPDRHGDPNLKATTEEPDDWTAPDFLDEAAGSEWRRIVDLYATHKIITQAHLMPLAAYCVLSSKLIRAPESFTSSDHAQLRGYASTFGFTPVDSDRISVAKEPPRRFAKLESRFETVS
jgi:phage terminase small subunit